MLPGSEFFPTSSFYYFCHLVALLIPILVIWLIWRSYSLFREIRHTSVKWAWLFQTITFMVLLAALYPGFLFSDDAFTFSVIMESGNAWGWQSMTYSAFLAAGLILLGNVSFPALFAVVFFLYLSLKVHHLLDRSNLPERTRLLLVLGFYMLSLHPLNQGLLLFHTRDILFSLMLVYLGLQIFETKPAGYCKIVWLGLLVIILGDLRQEAKIYLLLVPIVFYYIRAWDWPRLRIYAVTVLVGGFIYYRTLPAAYGAQSYSFSYQATAYILPLSQIFHDVPWEQIPETDRNNIDGVVSIEALRDHFNPIDIDPFHKGGFRYEAGSEKIELFKKSAVRLFLRYPDLVLRNRVYVAATMLNLGAPGPLFFVDSFRQEPEKLRGFLQKIFLSEDAYPQHPLAQRYVHLLSLSPNTGWFSRIFISFLIPMLFLCYSLFNFRRDPFLAAFAVLVVVRLPVLFLLAPAGYFKYVYSVLLFFIFGSVLFLARRLSRCTRTP